MARPIRARSFLEQMNFEGGKSPLLSPPKCSERSLDLNVNSTVDLAFEI
jgi:hypothetical protein